MKVIYLLFLLLLFKSVLADKDNDTIESPKNLNNMDEMILYTNIINPLLYNKVGLGVSLRNARTDYYIYLNYRFSYEKYKTTNYYMDRKYGNNHSDNYDSFSGFDIGLQLRLRNPILSKSYAKYIDDIEKYSKLYTGILFELSYTHYEKELEINEVSTFTEARIFEPILGFVLGCSFNKKRVFFDIHASVALGIAFMNLKITPPIFFGSTVSHWADAVVSKVGFGVLIGYKL